MADNPEKRIEREADAVNPENLDRTYDALVPAGDRHRQAEAAVRLRLAGATYGEIAQTLGFHNATAARLAVERVLAESVGEDDKAMARHMNAQRLLRVMRSLYPRATSDRMLVTDPDTQEERDVPNLDHLAYAKVYLAYVDRHIKLFGLDAPTEINMTHTPRADEFNRAIEELLQQVRGEFPDEADILEAEVIEEDVRE